MIHYITNPDYRFYKRREWKYRIRDAYTCATGIIGVCGGDEWVRIERDGTLHISADYAFDGASGPAVDTDTIMRAALVHDALYQLIRGGVPIARREADAVLHRISLEDGMWPVRAAWVHAGVRVFGGLFIHAHS
jgi:hypothetical protein